MVHIRHNLPSYLWAGALAYKLKQVVQALQVHHHTRESADDLGRHSGDQMGVTIVTIMAESLNKKIVFVHRLMQMAVSLNHDIVQ